MADYYPLFWLNGNNFGDMLGPYLYEQIMGRKPVLSNESPRILSCGSILGRAIGSDIIWGSGFLEETGTPKSKHLRIKSVRGPLSAEILRRHGYDVPDLFGDPALLLHLYFPKSDQQYDVGYFPHYTNTGASVNLKHNSIKLKPMAPVSQTLKQITACRRVVSSSLHGIIVAESFGIPAVWIRISNSVPEFKFRDYYLGTGRKPPSPIDCSAGLRWKGINLALDAWQPPQYPEDELLSICPFNLERNKQ